MYYFASCRWLKYCDQRVGMYVCLSVRLHISTTTRTNFTKFSVHVTCGRGSVLLWQCYTLWTSDFVDDVTFPHNGANGPKSSTALRFVEFARWRHRGEVCRLRVHVVAVVYSTGVAAEGRGARNELNELQLSNGSRRVLVLLSRSRDWFRRVTTTTNATHGHRPGRLRCSARLARFTVSQVRLRDDRSAWPAGVSDVQIGADAGRPAERCGHCTPVVSRWTISAPAFRRVVVVDQGPVQPSPRRSDTVRQRRVKHWSTADRPTIRPLGLDPPPAWAIHARKLGAFRHKVWRRNL